MQKKFRPPEICPVCAEDVPPDAKACPECGADGRSGWKEDTAIYDGLDLPDEPSDGEGSNVCAGGGQKSATALQKFWWVIGVVVLIAFILLSIR